MKVTGDGGLSQLRETEEQRRTELERVFNAKLAEKEIRMKQLHEHRQDMEITFEERVEQIHEKVMRAHEM